MSWPVSTIGRTCEVMMGQAPEGSSYNDIGDGLALIAGAGDFGELFPKPKKFTTAASKVSDLDDIILCIRATIGDLNWSDKKYCLGRGVAGIRAKNNVLDKNYLWHFMSANKFQLAAKGTGSTFKQVSRNHITEWKIPLPPLEEQKRIAAILDKADAIRRKRQQAIKLADDFLRSVFLEMFGDPITNPKGWEVKPLKDGITSIKSGWSAKGESQPCKSGQLGVLKISAVTSGVFKSSENKYVPDDEIQCGKKLIFPKQGDLLFSRANTRELVAATCIVPDDVDNVFLPDKLWLIDTNKEKLLPEFLHCMIRHPKFKDTLTSQATGTSGSMLNISMGKFELTSSIFPKIEQQKIFRDIYWKVQHALQLGSSLYHLNDDVFLSISQKAFLGEL